MRRLAVGIAMVTLAALALSWAAADDQEIVQVLTDRLKHEREAGNLQDFNIDLKVADGHVLLKGHVASPEQQRLALDIARQTKGVKRVINDLKIDSVSPAPEQTPPVTLAAAVVCPPDDDALAKRVVQSLNAKKQAGQLKSFHVDLHVAGGNVTLNGQVASAAQRQIVLDAVRGVPGVKTVTDKLSIKDGTDAAQPDAAMAETNAASADSDRRIGQQITTELKRLQQAGSLKGFGIRLGVEDGVVRLSGRVSTEKQAERAVQVAKSTPGVRDVMSSLVVESNGAAGANVAAGPQLAELKATALTDDEIVQALADRLRREKAAGELKGFDIGLTASNGVVTMDGYVSDAEQLQLANRVARSTPGVRELVNQITVKAPQEAKTGAAPAPQLATVADESSPTALPLTPPVKLVSAPTSEAFAVGMASDESRPAPAEKRSASAPVKAGLTPADDRHIGQEVTDRLESAKKNGAIAGFGIGVHVAEGHVRLRGRVSSETQRQLALTLAQEVPGVRQVSDELTVEQAPAAPRASSATIAGTVRERFETLDRSGRLAGANLDLRVDKGTVWVKGTVASEQQRALAIDQARRVPGVRQVVDALKVIPGAASAMIPETAALARLPVAPVGLNAALAPSGVAAPANTAPSAALVAAADQAITQPGPALAAPSPTAGGYPPVAFMPQMMPVDYQMAAEQAVDQTPRPLGAARMAAYGGAAVLAAPFMAISQAAGGAPAHLPGPGQAVVPARYDHPNLPGYAWPSYASYPNYAAVTYPKQYSPSAWPYIGPFYPYPQVPLGWRKVTLKWDDGWWNLRFNAK